MTITMLVIPYFFSNLWWLSWPFVLISTLFHELGHGLTAWALGGSFDSLKIFSDASGVAAHRMPNSAWRLALVAAGGPVGPPLAAAVLFYFASKPGMVRGALITLSITLFFVVTLWVRNSFGAFFVLGLASLLALVAVNASVQGAQICACLLGVQMAMASFTRADYLFMKYAQTGAGLMPSDTAQIAQALWLPHWFWGGLIALFSLAVLWFSVKRLAKIQ